MLVKVVPTPGVALCFRVGITSYTSRPQKQSVRVSQVLIRSEWRQACYVVLTLGAAASARSLSRLVCWPKKDFCERREGVGEGKTEGGLNEGGVRGFFISKF